MRWLLLIPAYLLGTFPSAVMVARSRGIDITKVGSGNPGASNISRTMGRAWGVAVFVLDGLKGAIPAAVGAYLVDNQALAYWMVGAAVIGHMFPVTRRFKGGKGVATMAGSMITLHPAESAILAVIWFLTLKASKKSSVASMSLIVGLPLLSLVFGLPGWEVVAMIGINALLFLRHWSNIKRLIRGTELSASRSK